MYGVYFIYYFELFIKFKYEMRININIWKQEKCKNKTTQRYTHACKPKKNKKSTRNEKQEKRTRLTATITTIATPTKMIIIMK